MPSKRNTKTTGGPNKSPTCMEIAPQSASTAVTPASHLGAAHHKLSPTARRSPACSSYMSYMHSGAETTPVRSEMVDPSNLGNYTAAGYHEGDTRLFIEVRSYGTCVTRTATARGA